MNTKKFVTRIINTSQSQIIQKIKSLRSLLSLGFISVLGLIPSTFISDNGIVVHAQQGHLQAIDNWYQSFNMARSKVQAASSPEASGNGIPQLHALSTNDILMVLGTPVVGGLLTYMVVRSLLKYVYRKKLHRKIRIS
ncbi:hypothetical protein [Candidatus Nitrosocosmicus sp. SS]|jgi:hypothetical protein|uniref:hypothetical protein n=1 Tax=Candidatus Nitrosocosmicus agrestis TaxID=2563600 RepID=UPI00122DEF89|nr:hypothetical protein [Candidatus Nitrosocosmicus sp. SS]KAA2281616.1 hypothetical protein F1Z66_08170 [Candidatus Nitrosocosmicus sp. SS]KAF0869818.1 hypothetical protein E5N71_03450 [Candidatus Nitrosocosmicus sp. SS]